MQNESQLQGSINSETAVPASVDRQGRANRSSSDEEKQIPTSEPIKTDRTQKTSSRNATGPRTPQGKQRSKYNALKHGLFSKVALLKGESIAEYNSLLEGLRQDFEPHGKLEDVLVEYLAALLWRKCRLLQAERAEVSKKDFLETEMILTTEARLMDYVRREETAYPDLNNINNLLIIREGMNILNQFKVCLDNSDSIKRNEASKMLNRLFPPSKGDAANDHKTRVINAVLRLTGSILEEKEDPKDSGDLLGPTCQAIDAEVERLLKLYCHGLMAEAEKVRYNIAAASIPAQEVLDRFIRLDAHTTREFDKTLNQLERRQRIRKGQPMPTQVDVKIS